jgi:phosphoglycolate phosphatase
MQAYNRVALRYGVPTIDPGELPRLRRMGPRQAMTAYGVPFWKVPRIVGAVRALLSEQLDQLEPFSSIGETLRLLGQTGTRCLLLSSNSQDNIRVFLERQQWRYFERVTCGASLFGKGKRLRRMLAEACLLAHDVAYVGDEVRDIEAARSAGIQSIAVSWGYADRDALSEAGPDHLIDSPEQLLPLCSCCQPG